jgi:hypothetical protein
LGVLKWKVRPPSTLRRKYTRACCRPWRHFKYTSNSSCCHRDKTTMAFCCCGIAPHEHPHPLHQWESTFMYQCKS